VFERILIPMLTLMTFKFKFNVSNPDRMPGAKNGRFVRFSGSNSDNISPIVVPIRKPKSKIRKYVINFIKIFYCLF